MKLNKSCVRNVDDLVRQQLSMFTEIKKKEKRDMEKLSCPKCLKKVTEVGSMTINIPGREDISGFHCGQCYGEWIALNVPKMVEL